MHRSQRLIALDLDGTLLDGKGKLPDGSVRAVESASAAGHEVVVCTGRGYTECSWVLESLPSVRYAVVAGGAIVTDARSGRSVHRFGMHADLVGEAVDLVHRHGHAALVLKDSSETGYDYLVIEGEDGHAIDPVTRWWFDNHKVRSRAVRLNGDDEHRDLTVRVGACAVAGRCDALANDVRAMLGERVTIHSFPAVVAPNEVAESEGGLYHVFEVFDAEAHKWSAVRWLAGELGVGLDRTCALGDQINDVSMIQNAALGVAMGNAVAEVMSVADRVSEHHDSGGAAIALDRIVSGEW